MILYLYIEMYLSCHSERKEEAISGKMRSFAVLRMTMVYTVLKGDNIV